MRSNLQPIARTFTRAAAIEPRLVQLLRLRRCWRCNQFHASCARRCHQTEAQSGASIETLPTLQAIASLLSSASADASSRLAIFHAMSGPRSARFKSPGARPTFRRERLSAVCQCYRRVPTFSRGVPKSTKRRGGCRFFAKGAKVCEKTGASLPHRVEGGKSRFVAEDSAPASCASSHPPRVIGTSSAAIDHGSCLPTRHAQHQIEQSDGGVVGIGIKPPSTWPDPDWPHTRAPCSDRPMCAAGWLSGHGRLARGVGNARSRVAT